MTKILLTYFTFLLALILVAACSELNTDIPAVSEINTHGDSLYSSASENYHPKTIANSPNGWDDCKECHAADFSGGVAKTGCNTSECHPTINVHLAGVIDPSSENFHGKYIRNDQWDMSGCQSCHAEDYSGGFVSPTCLDCHTYVGGPENCTTCHGSPASNAPPEVINGNTSSSERQEGDEATLTLKRVFDIDMQRCPNCGAGELRIIAAILERPVIEKSLTHLGLDPQPPPKGRVREAGLHFAA